MELLPLLEDEPLRLVVQYGLSATLQYGTVCSAVMVMRALNWNGR